MCGRYTLYHTRSELEEFFQVKLPPEYGPRYNIAPTQPVLIVRENPHMDARLEAAHVVWGLIPPWAEDPRIGSKMINARCETAAEKASFKHALRRRRCIVPVSGFYEWQTCYGEAEPQNRNARTPGPSGAKAGTPGAGGPRSGPKGELQGELDLFSAEPAHPTTSRPRKQPYLIKSATGAPLALAGLWEEWHGPNGEFIESCTILTTSATPNLSHLHDRMPVIIPQQSMPAWLDARNEDIRTLASYFTNAEPTDLELQPVSSAVNSVGNENRRLIEPL